MIVGSTIIVNKSLLGYEYHKILLKTRFYSEKEENFFLEFLKAEENIVDVIRMMGSWNYEIDIEVKNAYQLHNIIVKIRNNFSKNIKNYDSLMILKEHKLNFFPMGNSFKKLCIL